LRNTQNVLVILIEFEDVTLAYDPSIWGDKLFSETSKSVVNYFK